MFTQAFEKTAKAAYSKERAKHTAAAVGSGAVAGASIGGAFSKMKHTGAAMKKGGKVGAIVGLGLGSLSEARNKK